MIDFKKNGDFFIYSDPEVEVICREEHTPEDELYRYGTYPIPEEWLSGKPFGFKGDGTEEDRTAQLIREASGGPAVPEEPESNAAVSGRDIECRPEAGRDPRRRYRHRPRPDGIPEARRPEDGGDAGRRALGIAAERGQRHRQGGGASVPVAAHAG